MKSLLCCLSLFLLSLGLGNAQLLGYWDFNGNLNRSAGTQGTLEITSEGFDIGFTRYGTGTSVNLLDGFAPGSSREFFDLAEFDEKIHISVLNLNLSDLSTPTISFAARNDGVFRVGDQFYLEYNIGGGWVKVIDFEDPGDDFELYTYTFLPGVLDNQANVGLRITHATKLGVIDIFEIDNLKITAVPEPAVSAAVLGVLTLLVILARHHRRRLAGR